MVLSPACLCSQDEMIGENEKRSWGGRAGGLVNMGKDGRGAKGRWTEAGRRGGNEICHCVKMGSKKPGKNEIK